MTVNAVVLAFALVGAAFATLYFPLLARYTASFASPYPKADVQLRLLAGGVDAFLFSASVYFYASSRSTWFLAAGMLYLALRDGISGRSVGKFLFGLRVVRLDKDRPCTVADSIRRNLVFLIPGVNVAAIVLEPVTMARDPQGHRLGDRVADTQVVVGLGARDLVRLLAKWSEDWATSVRGGRGQDVPVGQTPT